MCAVTVERVLLAKPGNSMNDTQSQMSTAQNDELKEGSVKETTSPKRTAIRVACLALILFVILLLFAIIVPYFLDFSTRT